MPRIEFLPLDWICSIRIMRVDTIWWNLGLFSHNLPFINCVIKAFIIDFLKAEFSAYPRGRQIPPPLLPERNPATVGTDQNTPTTVCMRFVLRGGFFYLPCNMVQRLMLSSNLSFHVAKGSLISYNPSTWSLTRYLALAAGSRDCSPHFSYSYPIY